MKQGLQRVADGLRARGPQASAAVVGRRTVVVLAVVLVVVVAAVAVPGRRQPAGPTSETSTMRTALPDAVPAHEEVQAQPVAATASQPARDAGTSGLFGRRSTAEASVTSGEAPTVEELLEHGLHLAGASPVHLAVRGTASADTVRCAWRGIARTPEQREDAIRFWLRLDADATIPSATYLEALFTATFDTLAPEFRETAKSNFLAIARGGLSEEYLFLACYADYTVTSFLLGDGPTTVTVAFDRVGEARSYELYQRELDAGTFGNDALQTRGAYEASLQEIVTTAEQDLISAIGGQEQVVFLAPMGAHNAIAIEVWQAVAQWDLETDDESVVQAVRVGAPEGDPEHTQTLANLTSRIATAAASDAHATTRIANVSGLQQEYRDMGAYGDITPGDGQTATFTPALVTFAFPGWRP